MLKRLAGGIVALALFGAGAAHAGEEKSCAAQYSLEEHTILEWAALGGDPHAQFAIAQCAYPDNARNLGGPEKIYALKWLMLATCETSGSSTVAHRDRLTRKLKYESDLSFRRFGGITNDEKWTPRERDFVAFRNRQIEKLEARFRGLDRESDPALKSTARNELADELARMGGLGLLRLSELTSCSNYDVSDSFAAAAWAATDEVWKAQELSSIYGDSDVGEWSIASEAASRFAALSPDQKRAAAYERERLLESTPTAINRLENEAALGRLQHLDATPFVADNGALFTGSTAPLAAQYALEALGFMEFINGPDNDYGPTTIDAVSRAQAHYGAAQTRWLTQAQLRTLVCDAAVKRSDPVSYFHVALMFEQGWGYPKDLARARFAADRADKLMQARLSRSDKLAPWKQVQYPLFKPEIARAKKSIETEWSAITSYIDADSEKISDRNLCR